MNRCKDYLSKKVLELKKGLMKQYSLCYFNSKDTERIYNSLTVAKKKLEEERKKEKLIKEKEVLFYFCNEDYIF